MILETPWPETRRTPFNPPPVNQPAARLKYFEKGYGITAAYVSARDAGEVDIYLKMERDSDFSDFNLPAIYDEVVELRERVLGSSICPDEQPKVDAIIDQLIKDSEK